MTSREEVSKLVLQLSEELMESAGLCGQFLAELSEHGLIVSGGQKSESGRRYAIVVASNDAADALKEWARREVDGRSEAMRSAGLSPIVMGQGVKKLPGGAK